MNSETVQSSYVSAVGVGAVPYENLELFETITFHRHSCKVTVTLTRSETISSLYADDLLIDEQSITYTDGITRFVHTLQTPSGFEAEVESGYFNWRNVGIAVTENGRLVHESHSGEDLR